MPASLSADGLTSLLSLLEPVFEISDETGSFLQLQMLPLSELLQPPHASSILSIRMCLLHGKQISEMIISQILLMKEKRITNLSTRCLLVSFQLLGCAQVFTQQLNQPNSASTAAYK